MCDFFKVCFTFDLILNKFKFEKLVEDLMNFNFIFLIEVQRKCIY